MEGRRQIQMIFVRKCYFICFYYDKSQLQNLCQKYLMDIWKNIKVEIHQSRNIIWLANNREYSLGENIKSNNST